MDNPRKQFKRRHSIPCIIPEDRPLATTPHSPSRRVTFRKNVFDSTSEVAEPSEELLSSSLPTSPTLPPNVRMKRRPSLPVIASTPPVPLGKPGKRVGEISSKGYVAQLASARGRKLSDPLIPVDIAVDYEHKQTPQMRMASKYVTRSKTRYA